MSHPPNRVPIRCGGLWRSVPAVACIAWPCTIVHSPLHVQRILYTWHAYSSRRKWTFDLGTIDCLFFFKKKSEQSPLIALSLPRRRNRLGTKCGTRDVHRRWQRLCSQPGKQYAELWPALRLYQRADRTLWGESWQVTTLATDTNGPASAMAYAAHHHPLHPCMSRSSIPMWHGKRKGEALQTESSDNNGGDWTHSNPTTRIPNKFFKKKRKEDELFPN